jgi:hypothetical protein
MSSIQAMNVSTRNGSHQSRMRVRVIIERAMLFVAAAVSYSLIAVLAYRLWIDEALMNPTKPQPLATTALLCVFAAIVLGCIQGSRFANVVITAILGVVVGFFLFPTSSMNPMSRVQAIQSGRVSLFVPVAICIGALVGTLIGQNLVEIRKAIEQINGRSPRVEM